MSLIFEKAKQNYLNQGYTDQQAVVMAFVETGESDGTVSEIDDFDTSQFSRSDWFEYYKKMGFSDGDARFMTASIVGDIDLDDEQVVY